MRRYCFTTAIATHNSSSGLSCVNKGDKKVLFISIAYSNAVIEGLTRLYGVTPASVLAQKLHKTHALYKSVARIQKKYRMVKLTEYVFL